MFCLVLLTTAAYICSVDGALKAPLFKFNARNAAISIIAAASVQLPVMLPSFHVPYVQAAVNPLADVGLKEFLVKDGRQFLRLAVPVGALDIVFNICVTADEEHKKVKPNYTIHSCNRKGDETWSKEQRRRYQVSSREYRAREIAVGTSGFLK